MKNYNTIVCTRCNGFDLDVDGEESIDYPAISTTDQLLYRLAIKHNVFRYKSVLEYIIGIVLECIEMRASLAVDGFNLSVLNCLLDYVIMTRASHTAQLNTVVDYTKSISKELQTLDIVKTEDYAKVRNLIYTKKVLFSRLKNSASNLLSTLSDNSLFVIYSKSGCRFKFNYLSLVNCPFLTLSPMKLSESLLSRIDKPFLHVRNEELTNNVVCTPRHLFVNNENICPIERRFDIEIQPRLSPADEHKSADPVDLLEPEQFRSVPSEMVRSKFPDNLLLRLTTKYNCDLEYTSNLCTTLTDFLHQGKSVIVDNFSMHQLACLLDFVISDRLLANGSTQRILIYCSRKAFRSTFQYLDIVLCNQYQIIDRNLSFNPVTRVLISHFESRSFYKDINRLLKLDRSCLFVNLNKNAGNLSVLFSLTNCQILGLCVNTLIRSRIENILRPFINIRHISKTNFTLNDSDQLKLPKVLIPPKKYRYEDYTQQNYASIDIKNTSRINSQFLPNENPISDLISHLFHKHSIKLLTELPSDLYSTMYTLLLERRNVAVDGFSITYVCPLVSIYALECKSLDTPVSICYGTNTIVLLNHFQSIPVIPTDSILLTLTTNTDTKHLWLLIGLDNSMLSQVIPLIKITHQCVFLLSYGFPSLLEQAYLPITRLYKLLDCINIRSYNSQLISLLPEYVDTFCRDSPEINNLITSECIQTQSGIPVDVIPETYTANTTKQESNNQNVLLEIDDTCISMNEIETVLECASLDIEIGHSSLQDNTKQVNNSFLDRNSTTLLSEFVTESAHIELNVELTINQFYSDSMHKLVSANSNEIENSDDIEITANPNFTTELITNHEYLNSLTGINQDLITATDTTTESNDKPVITEKPISELESIRSFDTSTQTTIRYGNISFESDHTIITDTPKPNKFWTTDLITEQVSNELSELYCPPIVFPILLPDSRANEFNSNLASDLITSPVKNTAPETYTETEFNTELLSNTNALTPMLEENSNKMIEINPVVSEVISPIQHITTDLITEQVSDELSELYCPPIEFPILLPDSRANEFNSNLASNLITSPVKNTDTRIEQIITPELSKIESFNLPITNTQLSQLENTITLPESGHVTDISEQLTPNLLTTHTTTEPIKIPVPLPESTMSESDRIPSYDRILSPAPETYTETEFITKPGLEENIEINTDVSESNEISELYHTPLLDSIAPDSCSYGLIQDKKQSPSELGLHLITSPLQSGLHTFLFSTDSVYYTHILHHIASVLDCITNSLQVVITSQSPEICSQLLSLASSHLHTGTNGFLYKTGPIDQLSNFIVKQKVQILSIPVSPLVSLIQSNPTLFIENNILVYVEGRTASSINSPVSELLAKSIAKQCIFILADKKACSTFLHIFPTPYCEIEFQPFSADFERYSVEFNFPSL